MDKLHIKIACLRFRTGDISKNRFFEYLWQLYGKKISFYIRELVVSRSHYHEDLFQEVMIKIYLNLETCNPLYSLETWILKITRNHCIDFLKKKELSVACDDPEVIASEEGDPERQYLENELMRAIDDCIMQFDTRDRELVFLRLYENLKYREISEILNINISTLKARMAKITGILRRQLKGYRDA